MVNAVSYDNLRAEPPCLPEGENIGNGMMAKASQGHAILMRDVDNTSALFSLLRGVVGHEARDPEDDKMRKLIMPEKEGYSCAGIIDNELNEKSEDFCEQPNNTAPTRVALQDSDTKRCIITSNGHIVNSEFIEDHNKEQALLQDHVEQDCTKQDYSDRESTESSYYGNDQIGKNPISGFAGTANEPATQASAAALEEIAVTDIISGNAVTEHNDLHASHGNAKEDHNPSMLLVSSPDKVSFKDHSPICMDSYTQTPEDNDDDTAPAPYNALASEGMQKSSLDEGNSLNYFPSSEKVTTDRDVNPEKESHLQTRAKKKEEKLKAWRWQNLKKRAEGADKRRELSESRLEISKADEKFMKIVRALRLRYPTSIEDEDPLEDSFQELQAARNNYGPLEESYTEFEEQLDRDEYQVTQLEQQLSVAETSTQALTSNEDLSSLCASSTSGLESGWTDVIEDLRSPLFDEYRSRQADASLAREDYSNLIVEYRELFERRQARLRVGMDLQPADQAILNTFPLQETELLNKIRQIDADVEQLRLLCIEEGLLPNSTAEETASDSADILTNMDDGMISEYDRFPILLQQPENQHDEDVSRALITDFNPNNVGDRITKWLLHKLRSSSVEVEILARHSRPGTPAIEDSDVNVPFQPSDKWQEEVLDFWFFDDTNLPPSAYAVEATADPAELPASPDTLSRHPPSFADKDNPYLSSSNRVHRIQLTIRQSNLEGKSEFGLWLQLVLPRRKAALSI